MVKKNIHLCSKTAENQFLLVMWWGGREGCVGFVWSSVARGGWDSVRWVVKSELTEKSPSVRLVFVTCLSKHSGIYYTQMKYLHCSALLLLFSFHGLKNAWRPWESREACTVKNYPCSRVGMTWHLMSNIKKTQIFFGVRPGFFVFQNSVMAVVRSHYHSQCQWMFLSELYLFFGIF